MLLQNLMNMSSPTKLETQKNIALDQALQGRVGRVQFSPSNLSEQTKDAFAKVLNTKYSL